MKAACLLVCLALAHGISASIFKPQVDTFLAEPLDNIHQFQQVSGEHHHQYQLPEDYKTQYEHSKHHQSQDKEDQAHKPSKHSHHKQKDHYHSSSSSSSESREKRHSLQDSSSEEHKHKTLKYTLKEKNHKEQKYSSEEKYQKSPKHSSEERNQQSQKYSSEERKLNVKRYTSPDNQKWNSVESTVVTYDKIDPAYADVVLWQHQMPMQNTLDADKKEIEEIFSEAQKAMKHIKPEEKVKFHETYMAAIQNENEDSYLNATELAMKHHYSVEEHTIKTDDGYLLKLFRIPPKKQIRDVQKRPVVFLMHGILGSADDWLLMGPGKSLAYLLADEGYDVWLGNARGNKYSYHHVSKHPAVNDFWQFSTDEIALHDLPAMIDYTLKITDQKKLYYIGHSLGTTAFFAMTATLPEYNDKIIMMHALSPAVYTTNVRSPLIRMIAPTSKFHELLKIQVGHGAFAPSKELIHAVGGAMCENEIGCNKVCSNVNVVMSGVNVENVDTKLFPVILKHLPAGTSTKMIKHFAQGISSQEFKKYDYGAEINEKVYGNSEPPKYDMKKVHAPVTLHYSEDDWLAHPKDVERLQKELPNVNGAYKVPEQHFSHMDFQFSTKAPELVYQKLIDSMEKQRY